MTLFALSLKDLRRRKSRTLLTVLGVAIASMALFSVLSFDRGFREALQKEMQSSGAHMYVSTEGCPLEAASLILHGGEIPKFLPEERLEQVKQIPGVHVAAGMLIFGVPSENVGNKMDLFYGVTDDMTRLRPYWKIEGKFPASDGEIMLGAEVAKLEKRKVGDRMFFESLDKEFTVAGILERTGTQDDGFYFLDLHTAQRLFHKPNSLTAVPVGVTDLALLPEVEKRIKQALPDVYVVTEKQMTSEIQNFVGGSKTLITAVTLIAVLVGILGVLNTVLMSVFEKLREFGYMRCVGAGKGHIFRVVLIQTLAICAVGGLVGTGLGTLLSSSTDGLLRAYLPYAPSGRLLSIEPGIFVIAVLAAIVMGALAGLYPAIRAANVPPMEAVRAD